jgi:hypothetical protein
MKLNANAGFTLVEFVVAIVFVGVVIGPFLIFVARIHDLNSAMGQQGRKEAWRSFCDQALVVGIDPSRASGLRSDTNVAIPAIPSPTVVELEAPQIPGLARIVPLRTADDSAVAEPRIAGGGLQIGAGASVAARTTPASPLSPVIMPMPVVTPADGAVIATTELAPGGAGEPYSLTVQAAAAAGTRVTLSLNQPFATVVGPSIAQHTVTAVDLLHRVNGKAWSEYPGNIQGGDRPVTLADGRTRWLVTRDDGRLQIYEPSGSTVFGYRIALGLPVIARAGVEYASGASLDFDYSGYYSVRTGAATAKIDYPGATRLVFGSGWVAESIGFQWMFHDVAGAFSGDLRPFFLPDSIGLWTDAVTVVATPVVPEGAIADSGSWVLNRVKLQLGVPVLGSSADAGGFFAPGQMQFSAPTGPGGTAVGRLSFDSGANLSTGTTIAIAVLP